MLTPPQLTPGLALGGFSFALAVAFVPGALGPADVGRWALLSVAVPVALLLMRPEYFKSYTSLLGALFLAWAAVSLAWTSALWDGLREMWHLLLLAGLFVIGRGMPSLRPAYIGLGLGLAVNAAILIGQMLGWIEAIESASTPAALFMNRNHLAEPAALVIVGLIGWRLWWLAAAVAPCVLLTGGRGALVALAVAGIAWVAQRYRTTAVCLALLLVAACLSQIGSPSVKDRFEIWQGALNGMTWLGHGLGSFFVEFPAHAQTRDLLLTRPANAHNDFLEIAYELGPGALLLFGSFAILLLCRIDAPVERAVVLAFLTEAFFAFPLHLPVTAALAALAAGHLCRHRVVVCSRFAGGRPALRPGVLAHGAAGGSGAAAGDRPAHLSA